MEQIKKRGRPFGAQDKTQRSRKSTKYNIKKNKYKLEFKGKEYNCRTQGELAEICGVSGSCVSRIILNKNTYRYPSKCAHLKDIKINKI